VWSTESEEDDLPDLQTGSDSDDEADCSSDDLEYYDGPLGNPSPPVPAYAEWVVDDEGEAYTKTFDYAMLSNEGEAPHTETELYDSGASRHMSPFRHRFLNYTPIIPEKYLSS
jgi:hypothetical protein